MTCKIDVIVSGTLKVLERWIAADTWLIFALIQTGWIAQNGNQKDDYKRKGHIQGTLSLKLRVHLIRWEFRTAIHPLR